MHNSVLCTMLCGTQANIQMTSKTSIGVNQESFNLTLTYNAISCSLVVDKTLKARRVPMQGTGAQVSAGGAP